MEFPPEMIVAIPNRVAATPDIFIAQFSPRLDIDLALCIPVKRNLSLQFEYLLASSRSDISIIGSHQFHTPLGEQEAGFKA